MARLLYGGSGADVLVGDEDADGDLEFATTSFTAWTTRTGATQVTDLTTLAGSATTTITPGTTASDEGRVLFFGPDGYTGPLWLRNEAHTSYTRWLFLPWEDMATRTGTVDHGALSGLADDDHGQYYNQARGDARYARVGTTGVIPATLIDAAGDLIVGSANDTAARLARGAALQVLRTNAAGTNVEWAAPTTASTPALDGLTDVQATGPVDGAMLTFDSTDNTWKAVDQSTTFAAQDAAGNLAPSDYPIHYIPEAIINPGDSVPPTLPAGGLVWIRQQQAVPLAVDNIGSNALSGTVTSITFTNSLALSLGDYAVVCITISGEGTPSPLTCTGPAGMGAMTSAVISTNQGGTVYTQIFYGRATASISTAQTWTVAHSPGNRSDIAVRAVRVQGLAASNVLDQTGIASASNQTAFSVPTGGSTSQAAEVAIACFGYNPGNPQTQTFAPTNGWTQVATTVATTDATPRAVAVVYRILGASGVINATGTVTTGVVWSGSQATFKAA